MPDPISHVRFTKEVPMQIDGQDFMFYEGFCEHSDITNNFLPTVNVIGGSNVIETDRNPYDRNCCRAAAYYDRRDKYRFRCSRSQ